MPTLLDSKTTAAPYWQQHANAVARAVEPLTGTRSLILVGHSGAGPLLPAIRQAMGYPVLAYVFVDAGIPRDGASRLDLLASELPEEIEAFRQMLVSGERYPTWSDEDLRELIPQARLRQRILAELYPRALDFFEELIPVFNGWPDAACCYLRLSAGYLAPAGRAREAGWPVREMEAGHFHMLVEPEVVTDALLQLIRSSR